MTYTGSIDLLVGVYSLTKIIDTQVAMFLSSLHAECNLVKVSVFCIERECSPVSDYLRSIIHKAGFALYSCPLPSINSYREDTSLFCDWMVNNVGSAPWVTVSHFDVTFKGDYFTYLRSIIPIADMVGNHHDGIVSVSRDAYRRCQVGFCGVDQLCILGSTNLPKIVPNNTPELDNYRSALSIDVGELLAMRMNTLHLRHVWLMGGDGHIGIGKSDLFVHARSGSR